MANKKGYTIRTNSKTIYIHEENVDIDKLKKAFPDYKIKYTKEKKRVEEFNREESLRIAKETGKYDFKEGTLEFEVKNPFKIPYVHAKREQMEEYLENFCTKEDYRNFILYAHAKKEKGEDINSVEVKSIDDIKRGKDNKPIYNHIQAKDYFYSRYFKEEYDEVVAKRNTKKKDSDKKEQKNKVEKIIEEFFN